MRRFTRYSRISPLELCLEDERRALRCALALVALGVAGLFGALISPAPASVVVVGDATDFTGICVADSGETARAPQNSLSAPPPVAEVEPMVEFSCAVELPLLPEPEAAWECPELEAVEASLALELPAELGAPHPKVAPHILRGGGSGEKTAAPQAELVAASYRSTPHPPYPPSLRSRRAEGRVELRIFVDEEGVPSSVEVVAGSGYAAFDRCAREWVLAHWRFHPARRNGVAVPSVVRTQVAFVLC